MDTTTYLLIGSVALNVLMGIDRANLCRDIENLRRFCEGPTVHAREVIDAIRSGRKLEDEE